MELNKIWDNISFISYGLAKAIIESATIKKDYIWAKNFVTFISGKIEPDFRESFKNLMFAKIYFFSEDYNNARIHQSKVRYEDFIFYTDAKGIEARIEFETENYSRAIEAIESLRKYLKSHKGIPDNWNISFSRFANFLTELIRYTEKKDVQPNLTFEIEKIQDEIKNSGLYVYGTEWLLAKFNNLSIK